MAHNSDSSAAQAISMGDADAYLCGATLDYDDPAFLSIALLAVVRIRECKRHEGESA